MFQTLDNIRKVKIPKTQNFEAILENDEFFPGISSSRKNLQAVGNRADSAKRHELVGRFRQKLGFLKSENPPGQILSQTTGAISMINHKTKNIENSGEVCRNYHDKALPSSAVIRKIQSTRNLLMANPGEKLLKSLRDKMTNGRN